MLLDTASCFSAARSRDPRFDGRFFIAVTTTKIYCRPICPARTPKPNHVRFYVSAAAAESAGFRPCRRCRPDAAPGSALWSGTSAAVSRALRLIEGGVLDDEKEDALAARVGLGARHLRRLFCEHLGATPLAVAQSRRVHFARSLLDNAELKVGQVALASGFRSVRQFNHIFQEVFRQTPTEARRKTRASRGAGMNFRLAYRPPFAWDRLLAFLGARAIPGVEAVDGNSYRRTFRQGKAHGTLVVTHDPARRCLVLSVSGWATGALFDIVHRVRATFDLDADPCAISAGLSRSALVGPLAAREPGLRLPGAFDPFETLMRAILGQQVSVRGATTLSGRLVEQVGQRLPTGEGPLTHLFPTPEDVAHADLTRIGLPRARAEALRTAAAAVTSGQLSLAPGPSVEELLIRLCALPGIGPWTAQYLCMRAFGEPDAFPADDLVLRQAAGRDGENVSARELLERVEDCRPWRAYAALHLWNARSTQPRPEAHDVRAPVAS